VNPLPPWLTDEEIDDLCDGRRQNAARIRFLRSLGLTVRLKPNGKPIVERGHAQDVLAGLPVGKKKAAKVPEAARQPDAAGLVLAFARRA
jgi:hypothetical protein